MELDPVCQVCFTDSQPSHPSTSLSIQITRSSPANLAQLQLIDSATLHNLKKKPSSATVVSTDITGNAHGAKTQAFSKR